MKPIALVLCAALLTAGGSQAALAASSVGEGLALSLRSNVVKINSEGRDGFGFIVGEEAGQLYIVTANHVVRGDEDTPKSPTVTFYADQGKSYTAELLGTHLPIGAGDLAILRVRPPAGFTWSHVALAPSAAARDAAVWFVGKQGEWYVPARAGAVNDIDPTGTIKVEGLPVTPGTSGAPLISQNGIVGMVTAQSDISSATPLDVIRNAVTEWHYPWDLENEKIAPSGPPQPAPVRLSANRIAVFASPGDGAADADLSRFETQLGGSLIAGGRYTLVDQTKLATVLKEQHFSQGAAVDPKTAAHVGKVVGATLILIAKLSVDSQVQQGTFLTQIAATTSSDYQLLDVSTATVVKSGSSDGSGSEKAALGANVTIVQKKARAEAIDSCAQTLVDQLGE